MPVVAHLADEAFSAEAAFARFLDTLDEEGAVVSFVGIARPRSREGAEVERLYLDHHPVLTLQSLEQIARDAAERFEIGDISVIHCCGEVRPGEPIVFVATAARHRRAAFEAADYLMDRLKTDAVLWKREDSVDGARWIEPTEADRAARARWSD